MIFSKKRNGLSKLIFCLFVFSLLLPGLAKSQILEPVEWSYTANKVNEEEALIVIKAKIEPGWHLYSQDIPEDGPIPTLILLEESSAFELLGTFDEKGRVIEVFEEMFDMNLKYFENRVTFIGKIKLKEPTAKIRGSIDFMACDDAQCIMGEPVAININLSGYLGTEEVEIAEEIDNSNDQLAGLLDPVKWTYRVEQSAADKYSLIMRAQIDEGWHLYSQDNEKINGIGPEATAFSFDLPNGFKAIGPVAEKGDLHDEIEEVFDGMRLKFYGDEVEFIQEIEGASEAKVNASLYYMVCDDKQCLPPTTVEIIFDPVNGSASEKVLQAEEGPVALIDIPDIGEPIRDCGEEKQEKKSLLGIFILGLLGGFIALLTPCVFPMIPLTVSFFTKSSEDKKKGIFNAITYGLFILAIYILLSSPFHFLDSVNPDILNTISTNVWLNVSFFVIFVIFAISFFGYFEITLPSKWVNKADSASRVGGLLGIFFMALTLALVSFSCTGPILGSLLVGSISSDGGAWQLTTGMAGFGLALALPFGLFAMFPQWLNSLPSSGGWLNVVKVVLGFLELALAIKFLSNADLVEHWGILKREVFIALWIIIGIGLALYLFGKIKFPHDSPLKKIPKGRLIAGLVVVAFVIYLIPGLTNTKHANLKLMSGFPPPLFYSLYEKATECPLDLPCFKDYDEGMAFAKEVGKPVMLDFTGWACVNCRRMEENVWVNESIFSLLSKDYVVISLYVDDRKELPEEKKGLFTTAQNRVRKVETVGDKWSILESEAFKVNSQPYYVLLSPKGELLNNPVGYTPDVAEYRSFLECGLDAYNDVKD